MKYTAPTTDNQSKLRRYHKETFKSRRLAIQENMTITDILKAFPRFQDMPELINLEFGLLYGEKEDNFIKKWKSFRDAIIQFGLTEGPAITEIITSFEDGDKDVCGLIVLVYLLHRSTNKRKGKQASCSRSGAVMHLIQNYPEGTDVEAAAKEKEDQYRQPFILTLGPKKKPSQFFLVVDRIVISGGSEIVQAIDRLYKFHYVFSVDYSPMIFSFWQFIDSMIFGVMDPKDSSPVVRAVGAAVRAAMTDKV